MTENQKRLAELFEKRAKDPAYAARMREREESLELEFRATEESIRASELLTEDDFAVRVNS